MKIAWIVPGFSADERDWCIPSLLDLARVMASRHDLHIFALQYPYRRDRYEIHGATVHSIGGANRGWQARPGVWRAARGEVLREHRRASFHALHAFWAYEPGVMAAWLKARLRTQTIVSLAGGELIHLPTVGYGLAGRRWLAGLMGWALRRADVVTAGSQAVLLAARAVGVRGVFAPLGVDTDLFSPTGRRPDMPPMLINVGSLEPVKAQADLLRAFRFVVDREPAARLIIAGEGRLHADLARLAGELGVDDRVTLAGEVRREQLPTLYHRASLFVQTSLHEAQGMALLEAAACAAPIVGTPVGALADFAPDAAMPVPPGDPLRLAQAILSLLGDPDRRRALGAAAWARVDAEYRLDAAAVRFESLYRG